MVRGGQQVVGHDFIRARRLGICDDVCWLMHVYTIGILLIYHPATANADVPVAHHHASALTGHHPHDVSTQNCLSSLIASLYWGDGTGN